MTDTETAAAIDALTHRLRLRDAAMRDGEDYADPEIFSAEFFAALRGRGWRHVEALTPPKPPAAGVGTGQSETIRAELEAVRERAAQATARQHEQAERRSEQEAGAA